MEEKIINMNQFLGAAQGDQEHMLGKFLYFSLANLLVDKDELSSLCESMGIPYPDVVSVRQMCIMLGGISMKTAYKLLGNGEIHHLKIGKSFKIPKICVIEYLLG